MSPEFNGSNGQPVTDLSSREARKFFLTHECYMHFDLPPYFSFSKVIDKVAQVLSGKALASMRQFQPRILDDVNYKVLISRDGKYAWRLYEIIHPALYVSLVNEITEQNSWKEILARFQFFACNPKIACISIPPKSMTEERDKEIQIGQWWKDIEQKSIELFLEFEYVVHTDIVDCYGAIYTHSIAWALHTKEVAKAKRNDPCLIGNVIDTHIQDMRHGQTNGIPQGSVLMDFIAEMVLGYADSELSNRIESDKGIGNYHILRYRDDYRIFVNDPHDGERILQHLTVVLFELGLKLKPEKTSVSSDVIASSIKEDKLNWIFRRPRDGDLQKHLLIIHDHCLGHPNTGSIVRALNVFHRRIEKRESVDSPLPLISILTDIAIRSPQAYPVCAAILSKLLSFIECDDGKLKAIKSIHRKFSLVPNTGHMEIWIQRFSKDLDFETEYGELLCRLVQRESVTLWNNSWISSTDLSKAVDPLNIIDFPTLEKVPREIPNKEVRWLSTSYPW